MYSVLQAVGNPCFGRRRVLPFLRSTVPVVRTRQASCARVRFSSFVCQMSSRIIIDEVIRDEKMLGICSPDRFRWTSLCGSSSEIRAAPLSALQQCRGQCEDAGITAALLADGHGTQKKPGTRPPTRLVRSTRILGNGTRCIRFRVLWGALRQRRWEHVNIFFFSGATWLTDRAGKRPCRTSMCTSH